MQTMQDTGFKSPLLLK